MKALSEPARATASRVIPAQALSGVSSFALPELAAGLGQARSLGTRDLSNETARAAYGLGHRRGLEQGLREGREQGHAASAQALAQYQSLMAAEAAGRMQALVQNFREAMAALETRVAGDLVALAVDIARQVLHRELAPGGDAVLPAAREALRALGEGASRIELHANPQDAQALRLHLDAQASPAGWQLIEDASIMPGGCLVQADTGMADATVQARWQAVMQRLGLAEEPAP